MSSLKPGTLCVIIAGCPENIGFIVEVLEHLGPCAQRADAYKVRTVSGRLFAQIWKSDGVLARGNSDICITDRHKLRPLVDPKDDSKVRDISVDIVEDHQRELEGQHW